MRFQDIIKKPIITEKALAGGDKLTYVFSVDTRSNKHQIKESIEKLFKVKVASVRTHVKKGKVKRAGRKMKAKAQADVKMAIVALKEGKIDIVAKR